MEPHKHAELKWLALDNLPENLNKNTREAINEYLKLRK